MSDLLAAIRSFIDERALPLESAFLTLPYSEVEPRLNELREEVKRRGLWAPHLPVALGGRGLSLTEFAHVSALLGETPIGHYLFNAQAPDIGNCESAPYSWKCWTESGMAGAARARARSAAASR